MNTRELAEELIGFQTVSPIENPEIFEFIELYLEDRGIESRIHEHNGVYSLTASVGAGRPRVCLNGHVDVVEPGEGWKVTEPFQPRVKDGKLYGRGATDMKGSAAAMIQALVDIDRSEFDGRVTLMLVGDEELGGENGTGKLVDLGVYDYAVVGEPTDLNIQVGTRGTMWLDVVVKGESGHASRPESVEDVMEHLPEVLSRLRDMEMSYEPDDTLPAPTAAITRIDTDDTYNMIPPAARIGLDVRYVPGQSTETLSQDIKKALKDLDVDYRVDIVNDIHGPTKLTDMKFRDIVSQSIVAVTGEKPEFITEGGSSDGRFFGLAGTPFIELGTNQDKVHELDEYCHVEDLETLRRIYAEIPGRLDKLETMKSGARSRFRT